MKEFNSFVKEGEVYLRVFPGTKANQLNYQTINSRKQLRCISYAR